MSDIADFYGWVHQQANALRQREDHKLDRDRLAEEIEALGGMERREIESRLRVLLRHLLKWRYQPVKRSNSRRASVVEARGRIASVIKDSPSLRRHPEQHLAEAYEIARLRAADDTGLDNLPAECPWTAAQVLDKRFWPD